MWLRDTDTPKGEDTGRRSQQVEVVPSLVTDCKKLLRRNRLFWGLGIGNFEV